MLTVKRFTAAWCQPCKQNMRSRKKENLCRFFASC